MIHASIVPTQPAVAASQQKSSDPWGPSLSSWLAGKIEDAKDIKAADHPSCPPVLILTIPEAERLLNAYRGLEQNRAGMWDSIVRALPDMYQATPPCPPSFDIETRELVDDEADDPLAKPIVLDRDELMELDAFHASVDPKYDERQDTGAEPVEGVSEAAPFEAPPVRSMGICWDDGPESAEEMTDTNKAA